MLDFLTKLASSEQSGDLLSGLGIDWRILMLQSVAFVILVVILAKFVYPQINAMLDRRDKIINDAIKAAKESEEKAAQSEKEIQKALSQARIEAEEIVETAKKESADLTVTAEFDAKKRADSIVRAAQAEITKDIETARQTLRQETLDLVADATEKVAGLKLAKDDEKIVSEALKGRKYGS
ncbi:MAG: F0F1 ATP synthase subunit B [Candidatus Nomurabacteria bacterium]|jgi:F-type H+-transporting ATPase subunit b|nr:F0F1 ATP synthase subunit B [Candidatus Nomurabacteria bacterium]